MNNDSLINSASTGYVMFCNKRMLQNPNCFSSFINLLHQLKEEEYQIIELGTASGGLSLLLKMITRNDKCKKYMTIDFKDIDTNMKIEFLLNNIEFIKTDVFSPATIELIKNQIQQPIRTILICDNGAKIKEFKLFAQFLKVNDIILCHDYAKSYQQELAEMKNKLWNFIEIKYDDIRETCIQNNLEPFEEECMQLAAFGCFKKMK